MGISSSSHKLKADKHHQSEQGDKTSAAYVLHDRWHLRFDEAGILREKDGGKFRYDAYRGDPQANKERYEEIGKLIDAFVYELLESFGNLHKYPLRHGKGTFIFVSENWRTCNRLLVLIHGSGEIRAGQWSKRLITSVSLESGTQLPYIEKAHDRGWGVIVTNTNDEGSESPFEHSKFVWKHVVLNSQAQKIAIVANSAGGSVTASLVSEYIDDFKKRVVAIALTESFGAPTGSDARKYFAQVTCNWVSDIKPVGTPIQGEGVPKVSAGTTKHEETSHCAKDDVFRFIDTKFEPPYTGMTDYRGGDMYNSSDSSRLKVGECRQSGYGGYAKTAADELMDRWGLKFDKKGVLREKDGHRFRFDFFGSQQANKDRYNNIAKVIETYVYELLQSSEGGRLQKYLLNSASTKVGGTSIFVSQNCMTCDKLLLLIHGTGGVRAGQWSRRLIINDCLESGSQLPYIEKAHEQRWGVIVMNTNDYHNVEGSRSPTEHGLFVWKQFVRNAPAQKIAIVAHSAGGSVTASLVSENLADFKKRVCAIALTDSFGNPAGRDARKYFEQVTCNWVTSKYPVGTVLRGRENGLVSAGTTKHEETSHCAREPVFRFIKDQFLRFQPKTSGKQTNPRKGKETFPPNSSAAGKPSRYGKPSDAVTTDKDVSHPQLKTPTRATEGKTPSQSHQMQQMQQDEATRSVSKIERKGRQSSGTFYDGYTG